MTPMESVAGELGEDLHTRRECHSALKENISICFFFGNLHRTHNQRGGYREWNEPTQRLDWNWVDDKASAP